MQNVERIKKILKNHKKELEDKYYVTNIALFGSYAKGSQTLESDIDILVEFKKPITLIHFIKLENYLSDLLGAKVDLVMKNSLKPYIKKQVLKEAIQL
ncbi:nucleotidyltransferase family protein [Persephonella sp. IF05-L8]|uniref:nucleotidyltransferase domain-containing protein n=1 Tax=Persephonella sp. IF05-L8 TaxID=1158338 RepID=UPI0004984F0F